MIVWRDEGKWVIVSDGEQDPNFHWWQGPVECSICGHQYRAVIEIPKELDSPIVPMECSSCGGMTCHPSDV